MVLPRRWSRCRLLARYQRCRGSPRDHGGSTVGQGKPYGSRVYRDRAAFASSVALGQSRTPAMTQDATWLVVPVLLWAAAWTRQRVPLGPLSLLPAAVVAAGVRPCQTRNIEI